MPTAPAIRRILVAVDASPLSLAALRAASAFAGRLGAELEALFVEDINVVRLVAHPYVHTFSLAAARRQSLDDVLIEKALELQAVAARRALDDILATAAVTGSFAVRRGRVAAELLAAATTADMVCLGWSGRAEPGSRPRLGAVARAVLEQAGRPVLVMQKPQAGAVLALWDGSEPSLRALSVAFQLAVEDGGVVELLIAETDPVRVAQLDTEARSRAAAAGIALHSRAAGSRARCLAAVRSGILVAAAEAGLPLDQLTCSVVLVR